MQRPSPQKRLLARLILLGALAAVVLFVWQRRQHARQFNPAPSSQQTTLPGNTVGGAQAPAYALEVLSYIRRNGEAPKGYVGGREFMNKEKRLPQKDVSGQRIRYSEWDVHEKVPGQNRGPERLITGSDHSAYYTADHYKNFLRID